MRSLSKSLLSCFNPCNNTSVGNVESRTNTSCRREIYSGGSANSIKVYELEFDCQQMKLEISRLKHKNYHQKQELEKATEKGETKVRSLFGEIRQLEKIIHNERENGHRKISDLEARLRAADLLSNNLGIELEAAKLHAKDLIRTLRISNEEEKKALASECSNTVRNLQQALEAVQEEKKKETGKLEEKLLSMNENLKDRLAITDQGADQKLATAEKENAALMLENRKLESQMQESKRVVEGLTTGSELLKGEIVKLLNIENNLYQQLKVKDDKICALSFEHSEAVGRFQQAREKIETLSSEVESKSYLNSQLSANTEDLRLKLVAVDKELSDAKQKLGAAQGEKDSLTADNIAFMSKIEHAEKTISDFREEREEMEFDKSQLHIKIYDLEAQLQAANLKLIDVNKILATREEENNTLTSKFLTQIFDFSVSWQQAEKTADYLRAEIEQLRADIFRKQNQVYDLNVNLEAVNSQLTDLKKLSVAKEEEMTALTSKIAESNIELQKAEAYVKDLEDKLEQLRDESSLLKQSQSALKNQNRDTSRRLDKARGEIVALLQTMTRRETETQGRDLVDVKRKRSQRWPNWKYCNHLYKYIGARIKKG